jgi:aromatic amino acid transport protein AroP
VAGSTAWLSAAIFFVAINAINLTNVKVYGELEFWFSIVKVAAIISMIAFGCYLLFSGHGGPAATVANLWQDGDFSQRYHGLSDGDGGDHVLLRRA